MVKLGRKKINSDKYFDAEVPSVFIFHRFITLKIELIKERALLVIYCLLSLYLSPASQTYSIDQIN
jgi:hypothetical protein